MSIESYLAQLEKYAKDHGVFLYHAFREAGLSASTYHRTRQAQTELRHETAVRVCEAIKTLSKGRSDSINRKLP